MNWMSIRGYRIKRAPYNRTYTVTVGNLITLIISSRQNIRQDTESDFPIMLISTVNVASVAGMDRLKKVHHPVGLTQTTLEGALNAWSIGQRALRTKIGQGIPRDHHRRRHPLPLSPAHPPHLMAARKGTRKGIMAVPTHTPLCRAGMDIRSSTHS